MFQEKVQFVGVIGDQELASGTVTVLSHAGGDLGAVIVDAFAAMLTKLAAQGS